MPADGRRTCFVIMPFGKRKIDRDEAKIEVDFDKVYREVFREPIESMNFEVVRSDGIKQSGNILRQMYIHIASDDLAIVDITMENANVFYELGVRHALKPATTILTMSRGTPIPFDFRPLRIIEYPGPSGQLAESREKIKEFIKTGLTSNEPDSPIFDILRESRRDREWERIVDHREFLYRLSAHPTRQISIITGDLLEWYGIDVWVNSENTNMQMARFYDRSFSATIRYEGAQKDEYNRIDDDTIANDLAAKLGQREWVMPGTVYVTSAGALTDSRGVKKIFHAASVQGVPMHGYQVIQGVERCVTNALQQMDHRNYRDDGLRTIVFPMMGTGEGGGDVQVIAPKLIQAAISYLAANPNSNVTKVYFSAWTKRNLEACLAALTSLPGVEPVVS